MSDHVDGPEDYEAMPSDEEVKAELDSAGGLIKEFDLAGPPECEGPNAEAERVATEEDDELMR